MDEVLASNVAKDESPDEESSEVTEIEISVVEEVNMEFIKMMATNGMVMDHGVMTYIARGITEETWEMVVQNNIWLVQAGLFTPFSDILIEKISHALSLFRDQNKVTRAFYMNQNHEAQMKDGWFYGAVAHVVNTYSVDKLIQYGKSIKIHNSPQINTVTSELKMDERIEGGMDVVKTIYKNSSPGLKKTELELIPIIDALKNVADIAVGPGWVASNVATVESKAFKWMVPGGTKFYNLLKTMNAEMVEMYGYRTIPIIEVSGEEYKKILKDRSTFDAMYEVLHGEDGVQLSSDQRHELVADKFPHYSDAYRALRESNTKFTFANLLKSTTVCEWMGQRTTLLASYAAPIICCRKKDEYSFTMFASTKHKLWPGLSAIVAENDSGQVVHRYEFHEDIISKTAEYLEMLNNNLIHQKLSITDNHFHPWLQSKESQYADLRAIVKKKVEKPNMSVIRRSNVGAMAPVMDKLSLWDHVVIDPLSNNVYLIPVQINASLPNRFINCVTGDLSYGSPIGIRLKAGMHGNYNPAFHVARVIEGVRDACAYIGEDPGPYIAQIHDNIPRIMGTGKTIVQSSFVASLCEIALDVRDRIGTHYIVRPLGGKTNTQALAKVQSLLFSTTGVDVPAGSSSVFDPYNM